MGEFFNKIIAEIAELEEVEAIMLAGSHPTGFTDSMSDYDVCVYINREIPVEKRKKIIEKYSSYSEVNNQYWETEDDFIIADENILMEVIYRDFNFVESMVGNCVEKHYASTGYTTCFWGSIIHSKLLFDRNGKGKAMIERFSVEYPKELKQNIVDKNYPLLKDSIPAYSKQIEKALLREDYISVNHRIAALLASYFDILFAVNEKTHPGEKKLIKIVKEKCKLIPAKFEEDINYLTKPQLEKEKILQVIDSLVDNLTELLKSEGLIK